MLKVSLPQFGVDFEFLYNCPSSDFLGLFVSTCVLCCTGCSTDLCSQLWRSRSAYSAGLTLFFKTDSPHHACSGAVFNLKEKKSIAQPEHLAPQLNMWNGSTPINMWATVCGTYSSNAISHKIPCQRLSHETDFDLLGLFGIVKQTDHHSGL